MENKKIQDELFSGLKSSNRDVKLSACVCFVSLLRSDKMLKSILMEAGDFHKEILTIFTTSDSDPELQLTSCKALCNLAIDFSKLLTKETSFLVKLVDLAFCSHSGLKVAACFTLKNLLFRSNPDIKEAVMSVLTYPKLLSLLDKGGNSSSSADILMVQGDEELKEQVKQDEDPSIIR